jgi:putative endonuclease
VYCILGVTNNLLKRIEQHNINNNNTFTWKYNLHYLVYYEEFGDVYNALQREKQLKNRHRERKINLIESVNLEWNTIIL